MSAVDARRAPVGVHGVAGPVVRFGAATWFHDVLVRFGYDLFEHEHPWDGEWIDDAFETAAIDLRSTGAKLLRALEWVDDDPLQGPLTIDLVLAYIRTMLDDLAVVIPNCFGTDGRSMPRGDLAALGFPPPVDLAIATHSPDLYLVIDAAGPRPSLPKATARVLDESGAITSAAVRELERTMAVLCGWLDGVIASLQKEVASRAEDGDDLLARWSDPDWSVLGKAIPAIARHLPVIE